MKNYTITVNGNVYDVTVEEGQASRAATTIPVEAKTITPVAPKLTTPVSPVVASTKGAGSIKVSAGAAGKVFKIEASVGQVVKKGEPIVVIEAMKMEIPVVSPEDGTVASIDVVVGDAIEAGVTLATLN